MCGQEFLLTVPTFCQVARSQKNWMAIPGILTGGSLQFSTENIDKYALVIARDVERELLVQFLLPLDQHALGDEDQNPLHRARQDQLPKGETGLDGLA